MPEVNEAWVREQLQAARAKVGTGNAVLKLLEAWKDLKLSDNQAKETVDLFKHIALGHSLVPDAPEEAWVDAQPGALTVGDEVRVKHDAYDGPTGAIHNGRRGRIVAIRYGDIIVKMTDGKEPSLDSTHYSPHQLQKRVR